MQLPPYAAEVSGEMLSELTVSFTSIAATATA
jgi:hypothetical protein